LLSFFRSPARSTPLLALEQPEATNTQNAPSAADTQNAASAPDAEDAARTTNAEEAAYAPDAQNTAGAEEAQDAQKAANAVEACVRIRGARNFKNLRLEICHCSSSLFCGLHSPFVPLHFADEATLFSLVCLQVFHTPWNVLLKLTISAREE